MMMHASANSRARHKIGAPNASPFSHVKSREPLYPGEDIYESFERIRENSNDMREIIARVSMRANLRNIARSMARPLLCGIRAIGGWLLELSANQKKNVQTWRGLRSGKRIGIWRRDLHRVSEKAARFILDCNHNRIPLFSARRERLHGRQGRGVEGIIRAGAKRVNCGGE